MLSTDERYANKIFLNSVLPLLKVLCQEDEKLSKGFMNKTGSIQISAKDPDGKVGTHFIINEGQWQVVKGVMEQPQVELEFKSIPALNDFFSGKSKKLPKISGFKSPALLIQTFKILLRLSALLGSKDIPTNTMDQFILVKLYFYLLSSGISQLNKEGHPSISKWAKKSPDRVYAWSVDGEEGLNAYIRIKAGKSKAVRGIYKRSKPFFTMRFDSVESALGILLQKEDMLDFTAKGKLMMEGAPEYGAQIGEFMMLIGQYAT